MLINLIILCLVVISFSCVYKCENCDIKLKYALYSLCAVIFVLQLQKLMNNNINENFTPAEANEALQNIASLYNTGELTVSKLKVTGDLAVIGKSSFGDDVTNAKNFNVTGKSSFGDDITSAKNLTIGDTLKFASREGPEKVVWNMYNTGNRLHTISNVAGSAGTFIENDGGGSRSINTHWYQPNGASRLIVGTNTKFGGADKSNGYVQINYADGTPRWVLGDESP